MKSKLKKIMEKNREDIIMTLPGFINQLLLLMNSGVTAQEAFVKIGKSYSRLPEERQNYFTREITEINRTSRRTGESVIAGFYRFSRFSGVKELTRAANILMENRDRGTDLWEKLAEQGEALWAERKRMALERIRLAESKMSFPLGIMLLALIIIPAAPAMMQSNTMQSSLFCTLGRQKRMTRLCYLSAIMG